VSIQRNPLQIPTAGTANFFDNCSELISVAISDTAISDLFRFRGSTKLTSIDLSHNQINSTSFPETWRQLTNVKNLDLSHNSIQRINTNYDVSFGYNKPSALREMLNLASVDLSHNEISDELHSINGFSMDRFIENLFLLDRQIIAHVDLSFNKIHSNELASPVVAAFSGGLSIPSLSFHHNRIAGVFKLADIESCKWNFDGSYNRANGIAMGDQNECAGIYLPSMQIDMSNQVLYMYRL
jgi:hypothetical protein